MWFIILLIISSGKANQCVSRDYGNGGTVCVCNSTYCDTFPRPVKVDSSQFLLYTSNLAGLRFQKSTGTFQPPDCCVSHINIDSSECFQTIKGFGGAFTDSSGININSLPSSAQAKLLESYFSENGIEYNFGRVPIGGTDFSIRAYSYDDGPPDPKLLNFKLAPEDHKYKIPLIQKAMNLTGNNLYLFGSAWTAPKWLKTNHNYTGFGFIRKDMLQSWAQYALRFLEEYQKNGINFWGITTGNEPFDAVVPHESLEVVGWPYWYLALWIRENLGPTIRNSAFSKIKIMIMDDQRIFLPWYVVKALKDYNTRKYIDGIAVHWYLNQWSPPELLTETQKLFPEKFILATEACNGFEPDDIAVLLGSWERGEFYSVDIINDIRNFAVGWIDWNLALNATGGPNYIQNFVDSPVIINATSGEFYKQPMFYHLGHFSKFVPRGSVRIRSDFDSKYIHVVAFQRPDNGTVVVLVNREEGTVRLNIKDGTRGTAQLELSPRSINTLIYW